MIAGRLHKTRAAFFFTLMLSPLAAGCASAQTRGDEEHERYLAKNSRYEFAAPVAPAPRLCCTPYAAQADLHPIVQSALETYVAANKTTKICVEQREARIGVLALGLPVCAWRGYEMPWPEGETGLLIDIIDADSERGTVAVRLLEFQIHHRTEEGMVFSCIDRTAYIYRFDSVWKSSGPDVRIPNLHCRPASIIVVTGG